MAMGIGEDSMQMRSLMNDVSELRMLQQTKLKMKLAWMNGNGGHTLMAAFATKGLAVNTIGGGLYGADVNVDCG